MSLSSRRRVSNTNTPTMQQQSSFEDRGSTQSPVTPRTPESSKRLRDDDPDITPTNKKPAHGRNNQPSAVIDIQIVDEKSIPEKSLQFMLESDSLIEWKGRLRAVLNQIFIVKRILSPNERTALGDMLCPTDFTKVERNKAKTYLNSLYNYNISDYRKSVTEYGDIFLKTQAGKHWVGLLKAADDTARTSGKGVGRYADFSDLKGPTTPQQLFSFLGKTGLTFSKYHAIDVFKRYFHFLETEMAPQDHVGWLIVSGGPKDYLLTQLTNVFLAHVLIYVNAEGPFAGSFQTRALTKAMEMEIFPVPSFDYWPIINIDPSLDYSSFTNAALPVLTPYAGPQNIPDSVHKYAEEDLVHAPEVENPDDLQMVDLTEGDNSDSSATDPDGAMVGDTVPMRAYSITSIEAVDTIDLEDEVMKEKAAAEAFRRRFEDDQDFMLKNQRQIKDAISEAERFRSDMDAKAVNGLVEQGIYHGPCINISADTPRSLQTPFVSEYAARVASVDVFAQGLIMLHMFEHRKAQITNECYRLETETVALDKLSENVMVKLKKLQNMAAYKRKLENGVEDMLMGISESNVIIRSLEGEMNIKSSTGGGVLGKPGSYSTYASNLKKVPDAAVSRNLDIFRKVAATVPTSTLHSPVMREVDLTGRSSSTSATRSDIHQSVGNEHPVEISSNKFNNEEVL